MKVTLLKFDDSQAEIAPVTVNDIIEAGQLVLDGIGGIALNANQQLVTNLAQPLSDYDAATKQYVDTQVAAYISGGGGSQVSGRAGSQILSGTGAPSDQSGVQGDFYVQRDGAILWGPKQATTWGSTILRLQGGVGATGRDGAVGLPGPGIRQSSYDPPSNNLGSNGDYALSLLGNLYGPKANNAYPTQPLNLVGQQGPKGDSLPGATGASTLFSATTPPSNSLGSNGDLSITQQGYVFGPKQAGAWGQAVASLLGPKGDRGDVGAASVTPGPQGNGIRTSQSDPPTSALGIDGDYALTPLNRLYGPRANGAWPTAYVSLIGPKGDTVKGDMGSVGQRGSSVLYSQNDPPSSSLGLDNDLAITFDGYLYGPKQSGAWGTSQASLIGPPARDGKDGQTGPRGSAVLQAQSDPPNNGLGLPGDFGISPSSVLYGPKPQNNIWQSGGVSLVGPRGAASVQPGPMGYSIVTGNGAPTSQGNVGDVYLDLQTGNLYPPKTNSGWSSSYTSLVGPRGLQGIQGVRGAKITKYNNFASTDILPTGGFMSGDYLLTSDYYLAGPYSESNGWPTPYVSLVGPRGQAGIAGATIRISASTPDSNLGNVGDYVFEQDNYQFIGPKTSSGWPASGTSLRGAQGNSITGPRGASVLQADASPPSAGFGNVGDYALTTDGYLFGPKQANGWPSSSLYLIGARGAASTIPGPQGYSVDSGSGAPTAQIGRDGDAAYIDILNGNLYGARANGAWPSTFTSLIGPQGRTVRGSQIYNGNGPPSNDLTSFSPNGPAQAGDLYLDTQAQYLYVLNS